MDELLRRTILITATIAFLSCEILSAQNFERYRPPTLPPAPVPQPPDVDPSLPPVTGSDKVLVESLDAVVVLDDADKVTPDDGRPDAEGVLYDYPDKTSLVYSAQFQQIVNSYIGRPVSLRSINQLSRDIINLYRSRKQPIVDVLVPEQKITGGTLQIVVIETRIGSVMYRGFRFSEPGSMNRWIRRSYRGNRIYEPWLEEDLFWLNRNRFRRVTVDAQPGQAEGTTDLFFDVDEVFPVRGYVGYEDTGVELLGIERVIAGFIYGNLFGYDGTLSYQYTADTDFSRVEAHAATYTQPINRDWSWSAYGSYAEVNPEVQFFDQNGLSWLTGGNVQYHIDRTPTVDESVQAGLEFKSTNNTLEFGGFNVSDAEAGLIQMYLGYDLYEYQGHDQYVQFDADTWIGLGPGFTSDNNRADFNSIRADTSPSYIYARAALEDATNFGPGGQLQLVSRAAGQVASERLLFSEMLGFGGFDSIRGYDQRIVNGDHGWRTNFELGPRPRRLCLHGHTSRFRPYAFADLGQAFIREPQPGEDAEQFLAGVGVGCQMSVGESVSFRFDYGHALEDVPFQRTDDRVHVGLIWLFGPGL